MRLKFLFLFLFLLIQSLFCSNVFIDNKGKTHILYGNMVNSVEISTTTFNNKFLLTYSLGLPYTLGGTGIKSLTGNANKFLKVKGDETGYEFASETGSLPWGNITGTLSNQTDLQNKFNDISTSTSSLRTDLNSVIISTGNLVSKSGDTMTGDLDLFEANVSLSLGQCVYFFKNILNKNQNGDIRIRTDIDGNIYIEKLKDGIWSVNN